VSAQSRLDTFAPDVAAALRVAPPDLARWAAQVAAEWAVARTRLSHPALAGGRVDQVAALAAELDERYFEVCEARNGGRANTDDVVAAFGQARAASAVEFMRRGEPGEAIYEAAAAGEVSDWPELRGELLLLLSGGEHAEKGAAADRPRD
jgi:hypothetical protein